MMSPHKRRAVSITAIVEDDYSDDDKYTSKGHKCSERYVASAIEMLFGWCVSLIRPNCLFASILLASIPQHRRVWVVEEDEAIRKLVAKFGIKSWSVIAENIVKEFAIAGRSGKQCRERWHNHLGESLSTAALLVLRLSVVALFPALFSVPFSHLYYHHLSSQPQL